MTQNCSYYSGYPWKKIAKNHKENNPKIFIFVYKKLIIRQLKMKQSNTAE
jgi:hypothetical protein